MGLDLALVGIVLVTAIRGWFKGFMAQVIHLGALVAAVYTAAPVRDEIKNRAMQYLPAIRPDLIDRLLWWVAAAASYILIAGLATLALAISRRQTYGNGERGRGDQFAGFGFSMIKGAVIAAFLLSAVQKHGEPYLKNFESAQAQTRESITWKWNKAYQPADKIWGSQPVQLFVNQIQQMGLRSPDPIKTETEQEKEEVSVRTEARTPKLQVRTGRVRQPQPSDETAELDLGSLQEQIRSLTDALK